MTRHPTTTITVFVPVTISATDTKSLEHVVRELRGSGVKYSEEDGADHASFKIITNGVKTREIKKQFETLRVHQGKGGPGSGDPWPFPKNPRREPHPSSPRRKK